MIRIREGLLNSMSISHFERLFLTIVRVLKVQKTKGSAKFQSPKESGQIQFIKPEYATT